MSDLDIEESLKCPVCGGPQLPDVRPYTVRYKGLSETIQVRGDYCTVCGEGVHSGRDMAERDLSLNRLKARAEWLLEPEQIKQVRKKLKLSQAEASELIGGGPNAFYKYENGQVLVSRAVSNLLRLLDAQPDSLGILRARPEPAHDTGNIHA